jgi:hypothetical protein
MKKTVANELYTFVNTKANMDALTLYVNLRIEALKNDLTSVRDWETVNKLQGSIAELKRIYTLRDEVNNPKD